MTDGPFTLTLPKNLPDGSYHWTIGLYAPEGGPRPSLLGTPDRAGRIVLGTLVVAQSGRQIRFEPAPEALEDRLMIHLENLNTDNRLIDFGPIQTDGSISLVREANDWILRPWPRRPLLHHPPRSRPISRPRLHHLPRRQDSVRFSHDIRRLLDPAHQWRYPLPLACLLSFLEQESGLWSLPHSQLAGTS